MNPSARRNDVIVQDIGGETIVYDRLRDAAHSLSGVAGYVYHHADGVHSLADLTAGMSTALAVPADPRVVEAALWQLERAHLLEPPAVSAVAPRPISRRDAVRRFGVAALALASVSSIVAPTPAMARSVGIRPGGKPPHAGTKGPPPHAGSNGPPPHAKGGSSSRR